MKIAATYENGQVFGHFGHCRQFLVAEVENGQVTHSEVVPVLGSGHSVGLLAEGSTLAATRQLLEEGGRTLERVGYTRTTLALVPESQRSALEAEGWVCWDETVSAIPEAGTGASSHANAVIRAIPSRSQRAYITLDAGSESARVLPTLLTRLEARSYAVSVPLETRL